MPNQVEILSRLLDLESGNETAAQALAFKDGSSINLANDYSGGKNLNLAPGAGVLAAQSATA